MQFHGLIFHYIIFPYRSQRNKLLHNFREKLKSDEMALASLSKQLKVLSVVRPAITAAARSYHENVSCHLELLLFIILNDLLSLHKSTRILNLASYLEKLKLVMFNFTVNK